MAGKKCDCCGKNGLKTGNLKSTLNDKKFEYCLICGAICAEPKHLIDETKERLKKTSAFIEEDVPLIYYDKETDTYIDIRTGTVPFAFKDRTVLYKRADILKRLKKKKNLNDIFKKES